MSEIIFAKTRHKYDSYTDFWSLVELSGFPWVWVDEMELGNANHTYITAPFNGDWEAHVKNHPGHKATLIHWNLERPGAGTVEQFAAANKRTLEFGIFDKVIVSDRRMAIDAGLDYVPLGSHKGLGEPGTQKRWDVVHLMCYSLRRAFMFEYLTPRKQYNGITVAPNGWGDVRHKSLQESRFMLTIHQDEHKYIEPLRYALAAAYALPIVSEDSFDFYPYSSDDVLVVPGNIRVLYKVVIMARRMYQEHAAAGVALRKKMCGPLSFRKCLEAHI